MVLDPSVVDGVVRALAIVGGTWIVLQIFFSSSFVRVVPSSRSGTRARAHRRLREFGTEYFLEIRRDRSREARENTPA